MATVTLKSSGWSDGTIQVTYTALNGTLKITEIKGKRGDGYRSYNENDTAISVSVGGTSKSISLSHYVDFGASDWVTWGATDTTWTGLTGNSISISTKMQSGTPAYSGYTFSGNATMSWTKLTVNYYSNYATSYNGTITAANTVGAGKNVLIYTSNINYNTDCSTYGLTNYSASGSSLYMTRTGHNATKYYGTSTSGGTLIHEDDLSYTSGYALAKALGKDISSANASINLYAQWTPYTHTISYNANGGSGAPSSQTKTYGSTIDITSSKPTRTGYTFLYWNTESNGSGTTYNSGQTYGYDQNGGTVVLYAIWSENKLTVNYYSNYATYATYQGNEKTVSSSTNVLVHSQDFLYDNAASSGLTDVQNTSYLYLARIGYTPTGEWGTSTSGGTLINQSTTYSTGQALAQAFGKSLASGNASVNIYPQWKINSYTIKYNANGGYNAMSSQSINWNSDFILSNNLFKREGYKFIGWNVHRDKDDKWFVIGQGWLTEDDIIANEYEKKLYENQAELSFNSSWISGDEYSISEYTMYAVWEISGVVYIDNGSSFEPYLAYIDNGTDWELYLAYVDNGTDWNIIS